MMTLNEHLTHLIYMHQASAIRLFGDQYNVNTELPKSVLSSLMSAFKVSVYDSLLMIIKRKEVKLDRYQYMCYMAAAADILEGSIA